MSCALFANKAAKLSKNEDSIDDIDKFCVCMEGAGGRGGRAGAGRGGAATLTLNLGPAVAERIS